MKESISVEFLSHLLLEKDSLFDEFFGKDHAVLHVHVVVSGAVHQEQLPEGRGRRVEVLGTVEDVTVLEQGSNLGVVRFRTL